MIEGTSLIWLIRQIQWMSLVKNKNLSCLMSDVAVTLTVIVKSLVCCLKFVYSFHVCSCMLFDFLKCISWLLKVVVQYYITRDHRYTNARRRNTLVRQMGLFEVLKRNIFTHATCKNRTDQKYMHCYIHLLFLLDITNSERQMFTDFICRQLT